MFHEEGSEPFFREKRALTPLSADALTRFLALGGIVGPIALVAAFTAAGHLRPGYSAVSQVVSDLGLGPHAWLVNGAGLANAVLLTAWVVAFFRFARPLLAPWRLWLCAALLEVPALGYALAAVFTEAPATNAIHVRGALLALAWPVVAFSVAGHILGRHAPWRTWSAYSYTASAGTLGLVAATLWSLAPEPGTTNVQGLTERALIVWTLAWYVAAGWRIARGR